MMSYHGSGAMAHNPRRQCVYHDLQLEYEKAESDYVQVKLVSKTDPVFLLVVGFIAEGVVMAKNYLDAYQCGCIDISNISPETAPLGSISDDDSNSASSEATLIFGASHLD